MKLGFLASHGGSNMQAILDGCDDGWISATPAILICNNPNTQAVERAQLADLPVRILNGKTHPDPESLDHAILDALTNARIDLIVLAGFMKKIGPLTMAAFRNRIVNIHPSLLPKFGGQGMYGLRVHKAVLEAGEIETGATVHLIGSQYDEGPILQQATVPVYPGDTPEALQLRVLDQEHQLYPDTLAKIARGEIELP
ncbi:MAG: phosphoribosylglycinamide formyltransferase [Opitutales bacterium]|jgi:phosphoribosylglycinamide formyltransferase 1|nr:phosphoribosylglycinamide formyltransferase [Opitutales bacterium]MBT5169627.1 phosphoribosylglycinamide formyltransferase [Opitutales bacterium]MBT5814917.1 phosphoribosylglycinamide formyltransferase [Opitutales bacterium]MBT6380040.1 phosphoribosylglycinamide formyltransferase [Opitutales bacterium]MBT7864783.1 phosphoribosylglycinamide formyltransferase [Opitutales bacterium]